MYDTLIKSRVFRECHCCVPLFWRGEDRQRQQPPFHPPLLVGGLRGDRRGRARGGEGGGHRGGLPHLRERVPYICSGKRAKWEKLCTCIIRLGEVKAASKVIECFSSFSSHKVWEETRSEGGRPQVKNPLSWKVRKRRLYEDRSILDQTMIYATAFYLGNSSTADLWELPRQ